MPYVITSLCTNDGACVEVCPVACIHTTPGAKQFYIDPDVCIDCEQCEIVCPVDAIFKDADVPPEHEAAIEVNAGFFRRNKAAVQPIALQAAWAMVEPGSALANFSSAASRAPSPLSRRACRCLAASDQDSPPATRPSSVCWQLGQPSRCVCRDS